MSLTIDMVPLRGLTRVSGTVPNGHVVVTRSSAGLAPVVLRNGDMNIVNTGFSLEDTEAPIGRPVTYTATDTITDRIIQRNLVLSPDVRGFGLQSWTIGAGRTSDWGNDDGFLYVGSNPSGTGAGIAGRTIAEVGLAQLTAGTQYMVTGKVKFTTPDVWTWQDVKNFGTWSGVRAAKSNWQAVRSTLATGLPTSELTTLWISLANGATTYLAPMQVIIVPLNRANQWITFAAYFTAPAGIPSTARLRLLHGTNTREYSINWQLDEYGVMRRVEADRLYRLFWFKGSTPVPARPQDYLTQNTEWEDESHDASITWEGTPGNSVSRFTAPSTISLSTTVTIPAPDEGVPCEPVLLSDPVSSSLAQWFGLASIGTLTRASRNAVLSVLGRSDYVAASSVRGMAEGKLLLFTDTLEERANAIGLLKSGRVLLIRNPDPAYPETNWYISIGDVDEDRTIEDDARKPQRTWTVPFVQVERPVGMIEISTGIDWAAIKAAGITWRELRDNRENWLEVALVAP